MSALEAVSETTAATFPTANRADRDLQGLYERHADRILGFCRRRLRSQQEAEDAVQTTFLHALRALRRGVVPISEAAWLFKIAENVCLTAHRVNGRRSEREVIGGDLVELAPARDEPRDALFGLEAALATIPDGQRRAFVLRELRGLSYREIAAEVGTTVAAVETLVFRARRSLARALDAGAGLRGRIAGVLDLGWFVNALKTALGGAATAKVVAAAAVVAVSALPAGDSAAERKLVGSRTAVTQAAQRPTVSAGETAMRDSERSRRSDAGSVNRRDQPGPLVATEATSRTSRPRPAAPVVPPATGESVLAPGSPSAPHQPPVAVPAPPSLAVPAPPQIASPEAPPVPEIVPVALPTLPELPPPPVQLPDLDDLLPPLPKLP